MPDAIILTDVLLAVGTGTASADRDISNRLRSLSWADEAEDHDVTVMGSSRRTHALGLLDGNIEGELMVSYATGDDGENVDSLLQTLSDISSSGKTFLVRMRPKNANRSASNPEYSMLARLATRNIIDGDVGAVQMTPFTLLSAGDITRATATT